MATIIVDGISYDVDPANNMLQECLSHALDLPYFCWHPCMGSVGACRQCAVKQYRDADDRNGTIVMACMTPAADGAIISIRDAQAVKFRASVIESLMISHPHDCPVCEEGGECHLQDMTQMSGHNYRRYDFRKVTHRNQYLGPFINHEMNRCITCYRCVRFYNDYAGGSDLAALASHHHVYFGRHDEGTLQNEFSGNLVEVCPTGVFTDKTFSAHYTRKWDLQTAPSICTGCGTGCNTTPGEREGTLRRIVNRYHHDLNGYFLCDRGRFGYAYANSPARITSASEPGRKDGRLPLTTAVARERLAALADTSTGRVIGIGSPRASLEDNFALRELVGAANFHAGFSDGQYACMRAVINVYQDDTVHCPDIRLLEQSDCVLIVGEDITNTAPRLALAVRQASRNRALELAVGNRIPLWQDAAVRSLAQDSRSPVFIIGPQATRLDDVAAATCLGGIEKQLALVTATEAAFDPAASPADPNDETAQLAVRIADALAAARRPVIISGITSESGRLIDAIGALARTVQRHRAEDGDSDVGICFAMPEVNTMGLALMLGDSDNSLGDAIQRIAGGTADTVIVLENDLSRRIAATTLEPLSAPGITLLAIDQVHNAFNERASLLLPCTTFAEQNSTWVNYEGRAQQGYQVFRPAPDLMPARDWLCSPCARAPDFPGHMALLHACATALPVFGPLLKFQQESNAWTMKTPRQTHRFSGRTALQAAGNVHEARRPDDPGSPLTFSMEGMPLLKDARLLSAAWAPGWNSNQAISKFQDEVNGQLKQGFPGIHLFPISAACRTSPDLRAAEESPQDRREFAVFFIEHIFGGEELSATAPAIAARASGAYLSIGIADAMQLGLTQYGLAQVEAAGYSVRLPVLIRKRIAPGMAGIYCGGEIDRYAIGSSVDISPVMQHEGLIASSRQMFDELIVPDRLLENSQ